MPLYCLAVFALSESTEEFTCAESPVSFPLVPSSVAEAFSHPLATGAVFHSLHEVFSYLSHYQFHLILIFSREIRFCGFWGFSASGPIVNLSEFHFV